MVIRTAPSISCCRGPTESKTSEPWPENDAYECAWILFAVQMDHSLQNWHKSPMMVRHPMEL